MDNGNYSKILNAEQYKYYLDICSKLETRKKELIEKRDRHEIKREDESGCVIDIFMDDEYENVVKFWLEPELDKITEDLSILNMIIQEYEIELNEKLRFIEQKNNIEDLAVKNKSPNYNNVREFRNMIFNQFRKEHFNIQKPENYEAGIIQTMYTSLGLPLKNKILINIADVHKFDLRLSYCISLRSGNGKKFFSGLYSTLIRALNLTGGVVTSLHEEQLIGAGVEIKTIKNNKNNTEVEIKIKYKGYFSEDIIIKDDALEILSNEKFDIIRSYLLTGLDTYSTNLVSKKKVSQKYKLSYYVNSVLIVFIQDVSIPEKNVATGLFRKLPILHIKVPEKTKDDYLQSLKGISKNSSNFFITLLQEIKKQNQLEFTKEIFEDEDEDNWIVKDYSPIEYTDETLDYVSNTVDSLKKKLQELSPKGKKFIETYDWVTIIKILTFSAILKLAHCTYLKEKPAKLIIDLETCKVAFDDYLKIFESIFEYYETYIITQKEIFSKYELKTIEILKKLNANETEVALNIALTEFQTETKLKTSAQFYSCVRTLQTKGVIVRNKKKATKGQNSSYLKLIKD